MFRLSVIIPAYNEERRIIPTLRSVVDYLSKQSYHSEIIIISDGSSDQTLRVVDNFINEENWDKNRLLIEIFEYAPNQGKGQAVKTGMLKAKGEWRLFMDADNSTTINQIENFWPSTKEHQILIGSRALKDASIQKGQAWYRRLIGKSGNLLIRMFLIPKIHDTQCGFKLFSAPSAQELFSLQRMKGWSFDFEILAIASKKGFSIKEIPVFWQDSAETKLKAFSASWQTLKDLWDVRKRVKKLSN
ncbi:MAG: hypothetical protein ACD_68C00071G0001 [uncultured bacterium]|nr:MAG: hypothetical protein ACD_68C00071G0001 [uncultured bacterium]